MAGGALFAAAAILYGQAPSRRSQEGMGVRQYWRCTTPGGTYVAPLDRISSVSTHEFLIQGGGRVWELAVSDGSSVVARYYYMEPVTSLAGVKEADEAYREAEKEADAAVRGAGAESPWRKVVKLFPQTTHAHTVEYRLPNREALDRIFSHVTECLAANRSGTLTISDEPAR